MSLGGKAPSAPAPAPIPAPAASPEAPTVDGPVTNPGAALSQRMAMLSAATGRSKLVIPLSSSFTGGSGISIPT